MGLNLSPEQSFVIFNPRQTNQRWNDRWDEENSELNEDIDQKKIISNERLQCDIIVAKEKKETATKST